MEKITFCIPSKNNRRYLEACIPSIRKNSYRKDHDIIVFVDADNDGTVEWLKSVELKYNLKYIVNETGSLFGIGRAYDKCIQESTTDIFMIFHADMMLGKDADLEAFKYLDKKKVVCSTRIEPPLHPENGEKIIQHFGMWPEKDVEEGWLEDEFNNYVERAKVEFKDKTTNGCFAPWMMYKDEFLGIGGHDPRFASAREDSDVFNRLVLGGFELIQSWQSFVYHLTARGGQFQHGKLTKDHSQKSEEWQKLMNNSTREFFRKWGSQVLHNNLMMPIITPKYDIGFVVKNCNLNLLNTLEPWCSKIYVDCEFGEYIINEQPNTTDILSKKIFSAQAEKDNDVIIRFDGSKLTNDSFQFITQLPLVLKDSGDVGSMQYDIFEFEIKSLKTYDKELIVNENTMFNTN
jgi:glycosyltransferase involved in cell wall biosynthesis